MLHIRRFSSLQIELQMDSESRLNQSNRSLKAAPYPSFRIGTIADYPTEQCEMLMDYLGWSYEFVMGNDYGMLNSTDPLSSTSKNIF